MMARELTVKMTRDLVTGGGKFSCSCLFIGHKARVHICSVFK